MSIYIPNGDDFADNVVIMDTPLLHRQLYSSWKLYQAIKSNNTTNVNPTLVRCWKLSPNKLIVYMRYMIKELKNRGIKTRLKDKVEHEYAFTNLRDSNNTWMNSSRIHTSHRLLLVRKNFKRYAPIFKIKEYPRKVQREDWFGKEKILLDCIPKKYNHIQTEDSPEPESIYARLRADLGESLSISPEIYEEFQRVVINGERRRSRG